MRGNAVPGEKPAGTPRVEDRTISAQVLRQQIEFILQAWGMPDHQVKVTADVMVETDLSGVDSHGISMLMLYGQMRKLGQVHFGGEPRILRETGSSALIDAGASLGHYPSVVAMKLAIEKAHKNDVAFVSVVNSNHHGALGYYARMAVEADLFAQVTTSGRSVIMIPTFGAERKLGTSPIALGAPGGVRNPPVILDMATSVVAANKVKVYALQGKELPDSWVLGPDMAPLTDSRKAFDLLFNAPEGGLNPFGGAGKALGGHKGYGLAVFSHLLGGTLAGGAFPPLRNARRQASEPDNIGHYFLALNPAAVRPLEDYRRDFDEFIDCLRATKPIDPAQPVLLPGDMERAVREERLRDGVPIPQTLFEAIRAVAADCGASFVLE